MTLRNERVRKELMRDISEILHREIRGLEGVVSIVDVEVSQIFWYFGQYAVFPCCTILFVVCYYCRWYHVPIFVLYGIHKVAVVVV